MELIREINRSSEMKLNLSSGERHTLLKTLKKIKAKLPCGKVNLSLKREGAILNANLKVDCNDFKSHTTNEAGSNIFQLARKLENWVTHEFSPWKVAA